MVTYIYFVKCPNCEDEHFDFFDEAKGYAMGCLSQKPIITQTEVCRNDFGECTDSADLGQVWSWEDECATEAEPVKAIFTKDDLKDYIQDEDPEFKAIDNSVDFEPVTSEISAIDDLPDNFKKPVTENFDDFDIGPQSDEFIPAEFGMTDETLWVAENLDGGEIVAACWSVDEDRAYRLLSQAFQERVQGDLRDCYIREAEDDEADYINENPELLAEACKRKPIPEGMTINQLKEAMEENEDTVECAGCEELFPKEECFHKEGIGYLCGDCEDRIVKCVWCDDLYDKGECRWEVDFEGWLCDRCQSAIMSRGETLTFREGNYWDFLDENLNEELSFADLVKDSINHLVNDLGKDPLADDFGDEVVKDIENNYENEVPTDLAKYNSWANNIMSEVSRQVNRDYELNEEIEPKEVHDLGNEYDGGYPEEAFDIDFPEV